MKYLELIQSFYIIPPEQVFNVYIFEKPHVNMVKEEKQKQCKPYTKVGIHMIIGLKVERPIQEDIRNKMISILPTTEWSRLPLTNDWDAVLDAGITKGTTNISLLGSRKPANEAYALQYEYKCMYNETKDTFDIEKELGEYEPFPKMSVQYKDYPSLEMKPSALEIIEASKIPTKKAPPKLRHDIAKAVSSDEDELETDTEFSVTEKKKDFSKEFQKLDYFIKNGFNDANFDHVELCKICHALNAEIGSKGLPLYLNIAKKYSDHYDENEYSRKI